MYEAVDGREMTPGGGTRVRRLRRFPRAAEPHLPNHLRTTARGPAEFVGVPPWWLVREGILAGTFGVLAIVGTGAVGVWTGASALVDGEAGLVCAGGLALHLALVQAGRALVGIVALLGACLALHAPQAAAGVVPADRGRVQSVVVTSVDSGRQAAADRNRYLCSVADQDGVPLKVRIWRGCYRNTRPGEALSVVYDPEGRVSPRGAQAGTAATGPLRDLAALAAALVAGCVIAVVRSYPPMRSPLRPAPSLMRMCAVTTQSTVGDQPVVGVGDAVCTFKSGRGLRARTGVPGCGGGGVTWALGSVGGVVCWKLTWSKLTRPDFSSMVM